MKNILLILSLFTIIISCDAPKNDLPDPEYELGQKMMFNGGDENGTYIIVGYKQNYESPVDKEWKDQHYIVFLYINAQKDIKEATIHRNALLKE